MKMDWKTNQLSFIRVKIEFDSKTYLKVRSCMALHVVLHVVVNCLLHFLDFFEVGLFLGFLIPAAVEDPAQVSVNLKV